MLPPCARLVRIMPPYCTAQALFAMVAANATVARLQWKVFKTRPRAKGGRSVRYARTIVNARHVSQACMLPPCARLVRIMPPLHCPGGTALARSSTRIGRNFGAATTPGR